MQYKLIEFSCIADSRGKLIALENLKNIPFEIKRMYYIFDTNPNIPRGGHAHKNLEQILIAMSGSCEILLNNGIITESVVLNRPDIGLYIGKNMWRVLQNLSFDCRLVVLASDFYDEKEYIRNYDKFLKECL